MQRKFVETEVFQRQSKKLAISEAVLRRFQYELLDTPEKGDDLVDTGGCRKARMKPVDSGKSGGYRVIYLDLPDQEILFLLIVYKKGVKDTLTGDEKKILKSMTRLIKAEFN